MWKRILGGAVVVAALLGGTAYYLSDKIFLRFPHATVTAQDFDRKFTPDELKADLKSLIATVNHIHPDIAAITDPSEPKYEAEAFAALDRPMTRIEFFRVLAPFAGKSYHDGHTELLTPGEEWDAYAAGGGKVPPFAIGFDDGRIVIAQSLDAAVPEGAELVSLNGIPAARLSGWLIDTQSVETRAGQEAYAARRFAARVWAYGIRAPYEIVISANGKAQQFHSSGVSADQWAQDTSLTRGDAFHLTFDDDVAHLVVQSFEQPWDKYQGELKDVFQKIRDRHARAVVLDLRENSGGDTRQSDALQTYLSDKQLPSMRLVTVKATPEVKAIYRTLLPEGFRWIPINSAIPQLAGVQNAPDNGTFAFSPEASQPAERSSKNDLLFGGPLYLLISPTTYSTALIAAAPYKYWKRATVIGTPSSEGLTFFGDYYEFDLSNTKIQMHVSHKRFDLFGSQGPKVGLQPDIAVTPSDPDAYAIALREIAKRPRR